MEQFRIHCMKNKTSEFDLERTARLAIVFTLVSASMSIVTSGLIFFDPSVDSIVVLLPVVILTMLVDRIYSVSDERGLHTSNGTIILDIGCSVFLAAGTLAVKLEYVAGCLS